ncbi:hypothetical protein NBO_1213g0001 [Nosema bombycis CQ1]|uniref:Uncharacterized protein n=1 Tax=Nosema bombycis (strain CQ1 / CVCC 102059) TaxID=578461 RepID=R0MBL5_NOSB1|nr:hypothetical protein NBO_1213g0001 [Nosema bombycis CQ1]|eukprot:EOB11405.1 hypothetical protein NBO_1213g0001 [Nosema bombycis CQ1]
MNFFHLSYNLTAIVFLNQGNSSSINTKQSNLCLEQKGNETVKKFLKTKEFCSFFNLMEEVNGMIKEVENNIKSEISLNYELKKISKSLMDNATTMKSLSSHETYLKHNKKSIHLFKRFIPYYKKKKDKERTMIFSFLIEKFVFKLKDLNKFLIKLEKKRHLNLPRFKLLKESLNELKERSGKIKYNYDIYSNLLGENVDFYNNKRKFLIKLLSLFVQAPIYVLDMNKQLFEKERLNYVVLVIGTFGQFYDRYKDDKKYLKRILMHLREVRCITEGLKSFNDSISKKK